jgi:hypothetical protein
MHQKGIYNFLVVKAIAEDEFSGANLSGDSGGQMEVVETHDNTVKKSYEHEG